MSKRKIPLRSDFKRMPNWPGEQINPQSSQPQTKSSGSTLPYVSGNKEGFGNNPSLADAFGNFAGRTDWFSEALGSTNPSNLSSQLLQFLLAMNAKDLSAERIDALFQMILQSAGVNDQRAFDEYLKEDQRNYDWALKQEQRVYDNPQNQLARLMGAGISRDAALQMLSGSAGNIGGAGASSVPYGSGTGVSAPSVSAPSGTQSLNIANTVMNGVLAFMQLVQSGVGIAESIEQVKTMQAQNFWNSEQMQSYDAVKQVGMQIEQLKASGILDDEIISSWTNLQDMQKWLDDHSGTDGIAPLVQSGAIKRVFGTPFGRNRMTNFFSDVIKGRNDGTQAQQFIEQQRLNNVILGLQPEKIGAEMAQIGQNIKESEQRVIESCNRVAVGEANIELMNEQGEFIKIQGRQLVRKTDAEVDLMGSQSYLTDVQGQQVAQIFEYNSAGFPMLKQAYIQECNDKLAYWSSINDPKVRSLRIKRWLKEENNAYMAAYLQEISNEAVGDFSIEYAGLWKLAQGFKYAGVNDFIKTGAEVGAKVALHIP